MTKEEKIKEAWGNLSDKINENGWLYFGYACNGWYDVENWLEDNNLTSDESYYHMTYDECDNGDLICVQIRPKSLQSIENNNGWFIITDDLEFTTETFWLYNSSNKDLFRGRLFDDDKLLIHRYATHYQPIERPKPPIY